MLSSKEMDVSYGDNKKGRMEITMRDHLKDMEYFNEFINEDSLRIKKFSDKLKKGEVRSDRIIPVRSKIHDLKLGILTAKYSRGDELSLLENEYLDLLDSWDEVWEPEYYNENLRMISMGVLFEIDKVYAIHIKEMLNKSDISDWLFSFLLNSWIGEQTDQCQQLLFPDVFSTLRKVVYEENKIELLKEYLLNDWYNEACGCYEAHKSRQNIYYGYWSFEAGAIAKLLNVDDSNLKDVLYYPYDLVKYSNFQH